MKKYIFLILLYSSFFGLSAQTVSFSYTQTSSCAPATFTFTNTSTGNILNYLWDFGDGFTNNTELNPIHPYTNSGIYTVTFTVYFQNGIIDSAKQTFQIFTPPVFTFTKLNDSVCPGSSVSFTSSVISVIPIQSYYWDFGDGGHSTAAHPTYQYMNPSNITTSYSVSLTVTDANGCSHKESINNYIYVKQKPILEFTADQQYFCYFPNKSAVVNFINNTTVTTNNTYLWTFSDGQTSINENPTMSFPNKGNLSVSLTATSPEGCVNTISKPAFIQIVDFKVQYTVSDTIICSIPNDVVFRGTNPANVEYDWDFGDNTTAKSTIFAVNKNYTSSGTYTVKVKGDFGSGSCYDSAYTVIHVYDSTTPAMLKYDSITLMCKPFYAIEFKDNTGYTSNDDFGFGSIAWNFGDTTTAFGDTVAHIFPDYGEYEVTLSVTTPYGCKLKDTTEIIVVLPWEVYGGIYTLSQPPCVPYSVNLREFAIYSSTYVNITVDWGNGTTSHQDSLIGQYPKNTPTRTLNGGSPFLYPSPLYYDTIDYVITFTAVNEQGCVIFDTMDIFHGGLPPKAGASYKSVKACYSEFLTRSELKVKAFDSLDAQGHPIAGVYANLWEWIAVDNPLIIARTNEDSIALSVDRLGHFSVRMLPLHNGCPGDTIVLDSIAYVCPPMAGFEPYDISFCNFPADVQFQNNSRAATAFRWYFGDEDLLVNQSTDTVAEPFFTYNLSNSFVYDNAPSPGLRLHLIAYNDDSLDVNSPTYNQCGFCTDTVLGNIRISRPQLDFVHDTACEKNLVTFYDRSTSRPEIAGWRFELVSHNPLIQENIGKHPTQGNKLDSLIYLDPNTGMSLYFNYPNTYTGYFFNIDVLGCEHSDTLEFNVYPKSTPALLSGKDTSFLAAGKDTLCLNALDWLYLKDDSYTIAPFDSTEIIAWQWIIDNEISYTEESVFKNISAGTHDVYMRITNEYGCSSDTTFVNHILNNEITALFYPMMQQYCNHVPVEFHNSSYSTPYLSNARSLFVCTWDFGDGTPLYTDTGISNIQHTYHLTHTLPDTMLVTLTITYGDKSCSATFTNSVIITGPIASFTDDGHRFPCPDLGRQIQFTNTSSGNPVAYYWQFGDISSGNSNESYLKNPVHDYRYAGSYDITLVVTDNVGCSDTLSVPKHVIIDGPIGDFTYGELEGCVDHTVTFIPNITTADSIIVNPNRASPIANTKNNIKDSIIFTYQTPGSYLPYFYLIKWTYDNENLERCVVEWEASDTIHVIDIVSDFEMDSVYCSDDPITFINTSKVIPPNFTWDSVIWDFGNGSISRDVDSATIQYQKNGIYTITLDVYAKGCNKEISKHTKILSFPEISLRLDSQAACDSLEFNFIAEVSSGNDEQLNFIWTFFDGMKSYTNPTKKQFDSTGYYYYQLEVALDSNKCNKIFQDSVYIRIYVSPTANFEVSPQPASFGDKIFFTDLSTSTDGNISKWTWDLGDNMTSSEQHHSHVYNTSGKLVVCLYIEDENGCKNDMSLEIIILESLEFPNILTIGTNGMKYVFRPMEKMGYYKEFKMYIYNRWGTLIWDNTCKEPDCPDYSDSFWWDGRTRQGNPVGDGVYYWVVSAVPLSETTIFVKNGSVTIFNSK